MATNDTRLNSMAGGDAIRDFDDGTRKWPVGFIAFGDVTGNPIAAPTVVQTSAPLPVTDVTGTKTITGTVTANAGTGNFAVNVTQIGGSALAFGQQAGAASIPVVIASDQTLTVTANAGTGTLNTNLAKVNNQTVATSATGVQKVGIVTSTGGVISLGSVVSSSALAVVIASDQSNIQVDLNDGNGTGVVMGQKTMASSLPVVVSSNQTSIPVNLANCEVALTAATAPSKMTVVGAQYNKTALTPTTTQTLALQSDVAGGLYVNPQGRRNTFRAVQINGALVTGATDFAIIQGSATKTVYIHKIWLSGSTATAASLLGGIVRRSSGPTGGTFANFTSPGTTHDPLNGVATASFTYATTAATTLGTLVGHLHYGWIPLISSVGTASSPTVFSAPPPTFDFVTGGAQPLVIRGTGDYACITMASATPANSAMAIVIEFSEEAN